MSIKLKGYLSIEASLFLPLVMFLYMLTIIAAIQLYDRCVSSQREFIQKFCSGRYTKQENDYREAIYGEAPAGGKEKDNRFMESNPLFFIREGR